METRNIKYASGFAIIKKVCEVLQLFYFLHLVTSDDLE